MTTKIQVEAEMGNIRMKFQTLSIIKHKKGLYKKRVEVLEPSNVTHTSLWASLGVRMLV